jgi:hypothetical protein
MAFLFTLVQGDGTLTTREVHDGRPTWCPGFAVNPR